MKLKQHIKENWVWYAYGLLVVLGFIALILLRANTINDIGWRLVK
ncbi:unnamed protein product [marine sediment metagenome]|uniref:Uncharacterized protein n=1 Tax=marine sediment metagenome TaxID=412755 RepID=X1FTK8_9ZZZZ